MKLKLALLGAILLVGCTSQEVATAEADLNKALTAAVNTVNVIETNEQSIANAQAAVAALAVFLPEGNPAHQAVIDLQAAINEFKASRATIDMVKSAVVRLQGILFPAPTPQ